MLASNEVVIDFFLLFFLGKWILKPLTFKSQCYLVILYNHFVQFDLRENEGKKERKKVFYIVCKINLYEFF